MGIKALHKGTKAKLRPENIEIAIVDSEAKFRILLYDESNEYIKKATMNANIINVVVFGEGVPSSSHIEEPKKEEKKEEEEEEEDVGIGGLFG